MPESVGRLSALSLGQVIWYLLGFMVTISASFSLHDDTKVDYLSRTSLILEGKQGHRMGRESHANSNTGTIHVLPFIFMSLQDEVLHLSTYDSLRSVLDLPCHLLQIQRTGVGSATSRLKLMAVED